MRFPDRPVTVTGAAGRIGSAIAPRRAPEGADVTLADVNAEGAAADEAAVSCGSPGGVPGARARA